MKQAIRANWFLVACFLLLLFYLALSLSMGPQ